MNDRIQSAVANRLAKLLELDESDRQLFSPQELSGFLQRQLASQLDLHRFATTADESLRIIQKINAAVPPLATYKDLLHHPKAPLELLERAKEFAKSSDRLLPSPLPIEVATLLYYAFIAAGFVTHNRIISDLDISTLKRGFQWCAHQEWIEEDIKFIFLRCLAAVERITNP